MFLRKIVISTRHVYTDKCGGEPATDRDRHLKWKYPVINELKCFLFSFWGWIFFFFFNL